MPPLAVKACENGAAYVAASVPAPGPNASTGASTVRVNAWCAVYGGVLPSVPATSSANVPACVGVPDTVTEFAVEAVIARPAGRFATW